MKRCTKVAGYIATKKKDENHGDGWFILMAVTKKIF